MLVFTLFLLPVVSGDLASIPMITSKKSFKGYTPKTTGRRNKVSIKKVGIQPYVGIQVESDNDHGRKLILRDFTLSLNSGKWTGKTSIEKNWRVTKTCLRLGSRIIGKCMMGSTSNALDDGGREFMQIYYDSHLVQGKRNKNGQTKSGLYALFIPMEWNYEGCIDEYGFPVFYAPKEGEPARLDPFGDEILSGSIETRTGKQKVVHMRFSFLWSGTMKVV